MGKDKSSFLAFAYKAENAKLKPEFYFYFGFKSDLVRDMTFNFTSILEKGELGFHYTFLGYNNEGKELGPIYKDFKENEIEIMLDYSRLAYKMFNVKEIDCLEVYGKDIKKLAEIFEKWATKTN